MTADEWEPSEKLLEIAASILVRSDNCIDFFVNAIKAVRPLLIAEEREQWDARKAALDAHAREIIGETAAAIAEARSQIEAEERERIAKLVRGAVYKEHYRTWDYMKFEGGQGNRSNESELVRHSDALADTILALKDNKPCP